MAVAKKATKKTTKKVVKKAVAKKTAAPKKAAAPVVSPLTKARVLIAHDLVNRNELRVGDEFLTMYEVDGLDLGVNHNWSRMGGGEAVTFLGINDQGLLVCQHDDDAEGEYTLLPVEAVDFAEITEAPDVSRSSEVRLNGSYTAVVEKDNEVVRVGCQNFPINNIREVIKTYDRLNDKKASGKDQDRSTTQRADGTYTELTFVPVK
ncbi:hypothetical protein [Stenotrophomonas phage BUCTxx99]|nr:hypothetical protein [Stenotrophomonas phage BUCTxx99]